MPSPAVLRPAHAGDGHRSPGLGAHQQGCSLTGIMIAAAIVIANMIGAGVFTTTGFQAAYSFTDPWTMMSMWLVGGVIALVVSAVAARSL